MEKSRIKSLEYNNKNKDVIDAILSPTEIIRPCPYLFNPKYEHLGEDPREIYLSSAFWKWHWMWGHIKEAVKGMYEGTQILFATDWCLSVKHNIRTMAQMVKEKRKLGDFTFDMEYNNLMLGGSDSAYYTYDMIAKNQVLKKPWYPKTKQEYFDYVNKKKKRSWDVERQKGEVRIVVADIAMLDSDSRTKNDNSVTKCVRALPNGTDYERHFVYTEVVKENKLTDEQAIRLRQIMEDFDADYLVLDLRNAGVSILDLVGKVLYDEERDIEYPPIKCFNIEKYKNRCKTMGASPIIYGIIGSDELNDEVHRTVLSSLSRGKIKMLLGSMYCKEDYLIDREEYKNADVDGKVLMELPYYESDLTLNEMVALNKNLIKNGRYIQLVEPSTGTKDRYMTLGYANHFIDTLERKLGANTQIDIGATQLPQYFASSLNWI